MLTHLTTEQKFAFKRQVKDQCVSIMQQRINTLQEAMQSAQESANSDDKSSAGDKYEVGRAMGHLQQEMLVEQLGKANDEMALINSLHTESLCHTATNGAVVVCKDFVFFIALGLGSIVVNNQKIIVLSPIAPLAVLLLDKRASDIFEFNKKRVEILEVF